MSDDETARPPPKRFRRRRWVNFGVQSTGFGFVCWMRISSWIYTAPRPVYFLAALIPILGAPVWWFGAVRQEWSRTAEIAAAQDRGEQAPGHRGPG